MMRRSEKGFALLTVLWLVLLLSVLVSSRIAPVVTAQHAQINRLLEARARWAALGCLELTRARFRRGRFERSQDSVALGAVVWCEQESLQSDERVNPNVGDSLGLLRLLRDEHAVGSLLDWLDEDDSARAGGSESQWYRRHGRYLPRNGPMMDVAEMQLVRGLEHLDAARLEDLFTTRGGGRLSANRAPEWALQSISVLSTDRIAGILRHRRGATAYATADQITAITGMELTIPEFAELTTRLSFDDGERTVRVRGRVNAGPRIVESVLVVTLVPYEGDLNVRRVEVR